MRGIRTETYFGRSTCEEAWEKLQGQESKRWAYAKARNARMETLMQRKIEQIERAKTEAAKAVAQRKYNLWMGTWVEQSEIRAFRVKRIFNQLKPRIIESFPLQNVIFDKTQN